MNDRVFSVGYYSTAMCVRAFACVHISHCVATRQIAPQIHNATIVSIVASVSSKKKKSILPIFQLLFSQFSR